MKELDQMWLNVVNFRGNMGWRLAYGEGTKNVVLYGEDHRGKAPAEEFLDKLDGASQDSMMHRITYHAENGPSLNPQQYEEVKGHPGIFELKALKVRLLGFEIDEGHDLMLTNGYKKSLKPKEIEREYEKAEKMRQALQEEMKHG